MEGQEIAGPRASWTWTLKVQGVVLLTPSVATQVVEVKVDPSVPLGPMSPNNDPVGGVHTRDLMPEASMALTGRVIGALGDPPSVDTFTVVGQVSVGAN